MWPTPYFFITIGSASLAIYLTKKDQGVIMQSAKVHKYAGIITLIVVIIVGSLGLARVLYPYFCEKEWNTLKLQRLKAAHKYMAYVLIIGS